MVKIAFGLSFAIEHNLFWKAHELQHVFKTYISQPVWSDIGLSRKTGPLAVQSDIANPSVGSQVKQICQPFTQAAKRGLGPPYIHGQQ